MTIATENIDPAKVAALVVSAARAELLPRFQRVQHRFKPDGSVITEADHAMQAALAEGLADLAPELPLLSEEMTPAEQRAAMAGGSPGYWCLDPLDGTSNFAAGVPFFAVSLACVRGTAVDLALVYDPVRDELFMASEVAGATLNGRRMEASAAPPLARCLAVVDFKRLPPEVAGRLAAHPPYGSQRNFGACALEWSWLAAGRFHVYAHGGQKLWDYAAGLHILRLAGGRACTLDGAEIRPAGLTPCSVMAVREAGLLPPWTEAISGKS